MHDFRCIECGRLLARISGEAVVAVKCPRCKKLNTTQNAKSVSLEDRESQTKRDSHERFQCSKTKSSA